MKIVMENKLTEERKTAEDYEGGTVVEFLNDDFPFERYLGIVLKDIDREIIGIFDLEDNIVYTDYRNYPITRTFPNAELKLQ